MFPFRVGSVWKVSACKIKSVFFTQENEIKPSSGVTPAQPKVELKAEVKAQPEKIVKPVPAPSKVKRTPKVDPFKKFLKPEAEKSPKAKSSKTDSVK